MASRQTRQKLSRLRENMMQSITKIGLACMVITGNLNRQEYYNLDIDLRSYFKYIPIVLYLQQGIPKGFCR